MNKFIESFINDKTFVLLNKNENCYIFKDQKTLHELKIDIIDNDKINIEFGDKFNV